MSNLMHGVDKSLASSDGRRGLPGNDHQPEMFEPGTIEYGELERVKKRELSRRRVSTVRQSAPALVRSFSCVKMRVLVVGSWGIPVSYTNSCEKRPASTRRHTDTCDGSFGNRRSSRLVCTLCYVQSQSLFSESLCCQQSEAIATSRPRSWKEGLGTDESPFRIMFVVISFAHLQVVGLPGPAGPALHW